MTAAARDLGTTLLAAALFAAVAMWWTWPLALHPGSAIAQLASEDPQWNPVIFFDRLLTIAGTARNADALLAFAPRTLIETGLCSPHPQAAALGEHMIELGVLAAPFRALSDNTVLVHNVTLLSSFILSGLGMFLLVRHLTGSVAAAILAGLALAIHPTRLMNLSHPFVVAIHWIPFALLFFERLLRHGRIADATALSVVATLQCVTGAYPLLTFAVLMLPYACLRLFAYRSLLDLRRLALLGAAAAITGVVTLWVLLAYIHQGEVWSVFQLRNRVFVSYQELSFGSRATFGVLMPLLALTALVSAAVDLVKPAEPRDRPGLPLAALITAALACVSFGAQGTLWPGGPQGPSLFRALEPLVPMLSAIRAPGAVSMGATLSLLILAGIGMGRLTTRLRPIGAVAASAVIVAALLAETFNPTFARAVYGRDHRAELRPIAARAAETGAYRSFDEHGYDGAVIDVPYPASVGRGIVAQSHYTFMAGIHGRATAACYNSFNPPSHFNLVRIAARLPAARALDELAAVGLRNIVVHRNGAAYGNGAARGRDAAAGLIRLLESADGVELLETNKDAAALRITKRIDTTADVASLELLGIVTPKIFAPARKAADMLARFVEIGVRNNAATVFRLPDPIAPVQARALWYRASAPASASAAAADSAPAYTVEHQALLPLALAAGAEDTIQLDLRPYPPVGRYRLAIELPGLKLRLEAPATVEVRR